jgi:hypothetical protein
MSGDFDFYVGTWEVANRRLTARLADSQDWEEFRRCRSLGRSSAVPATWTRSHFLPAVGRG